MATYEGMKNDRKIHAKSERRVLKKRLREQKKLDRLEEVERLKMLKSIKLSSWQAPGGSSLIKNKALQPPLMSEVFSTAPHVTSINNSIETLACEPRTINQPRITSSSDPDGRKDPDGSIYHLLRMPPEVLDSIFSYLDQEHWLRLMKMNSIVADCVKRHLYKAPRFSTSYRLAQFVWLVCNRIGYANLVRSVHIANINEQGAQDDAQDCPTWQDFKFRNHDIYGPLPPTSVNHLNLCSNDLLLTSRFVAFGTIIQLLRACSKIR